MEFDFVYDFYEGFAVVKKDGKYNFINENEELLCEEWFDKAWNFYDGLAKVEKDDKYNFIKPDGAILSDEWLDKAYDFHGDFAVIRKGNVYNMKFNLVGKDGKLVFKRGCKSHATLERAAKRIGIYC